MCFISSRGDESLSKVDFKKISTNNEGIFNKLLILTRLPKFKFKNEKGWRGVYYPLSPPLVSPETKFFCKKKKSVQIGRAMRIAPAEK